MTIFNTALALPVAGTVRPRSRSLPTALDTERPPPTAQAANDAIHAAIALVLGDARNAAVAVPPAHTAPSRGMLEHARFETLDRGRMVDDCHDDLPALMPERVHDNPLDDWNNNRIDLSANDPAWQRTANRPAQNGDRDDHPMLGAARDVMVRGLHAIGAAGRQAWVALSNALGFGNDADPGNNGASEAASSDAPEMLSRHNLWPAMRGNGASAALRNGSGGLLLWVWPIMPFSTMPALLAPMALVCMIAAAIYAGMRLRHCRAAENPALQYGAAALYGIGVAGTVFADRAGSVGKIVGFIADKAWEMLVTCGLTGESGPGNASRRTLSSWLAVIFVTFLGMHYTRAGLFLAIENAEMDAVATLFVKWAAKLFSEVLAFGGIMPALQYVGNATADAGFVYRSARYRWTSWRRFLAERARYATRMGRHAELYSNLGADKFVGFAAPANNGVQTWIWPVNSALGAMLETEKVFSAYAKRQDRACATTPARPTDAAARVEAGDIENVVAARFSGAALPSVRMANEQVSELTSL